VYVNINGLPTTQSWEYSAFTDFKLAESRFKKLLEEGTYNSEHYFVAQLYEEHWQPKSTV
jgi:hypothetical protein